MQPSESRDKERERAKISIACKPPFYSIFRLQFLQWCRYPSISPPSLPNDLFSVAHYCRQAKHRAISVLGRGMRIASTTFQGSPLAGLACAPKFLLFVLFLLLQVRYDPGSRFSSITPSQCQPFFLKTQSLDVQQMASTYWLPYSAACAVEGLKLGKLSKSRLSSGGRNYTKLLSLVLFHSISHLILRF